MSDTIILPPPNSVFHWLTPDELTSAPLRSAVEYWRRLRGDRPFPPREALNPREMQSLLTYMSLVKVIEGGVDFEHRIVGDAIVQSFSIPMQNRRFSDIIKDAPEWIGYALPLFRKVVDTGLPVAWHVRRGIDASYVAFSEAETVLLPLGNAPPTVDHVVGFGFHRRQTRHA